MLQQEADKSKRIDATLETALAYIRAGIQTHPVHKATLGNDQTGKIPALEDWRNVRLTEEQFRKLYRRGMNIGVCPGKQSGFVVVDIDKKNGGLHWYKASQDRIGNPIVEKTPGGGLHLYYAYPKGFEGIIYTRKGSFGIAEGVEVFGDDSGQVITSPSKHWTGGHYEIDDGLTLLDIQKEADELPDWLIKATVENYKPPMASGEKGAVIPGLDTDHPTNIERAIAFIQSRSAPIVSHGRNDATYKACCACRDYGLSKQMTHKVVMEHFLSRTVGDPREFYDDADLWTIVNSVYKNAKLPMGNKTAAGDFSEVTKEDEDYIESEKKREESENGHVSASKPVVGKRLKDDLKRPYLLAQMLLDQLNGRVKGCNDNLSFYSNEENCWDLIGERSLRGLIIEGMEKQYSEALKLLKTTNVSAITEAIMDSLAREGFIDTENRWLDGAFEGDDYIRLDNGILDIVNGEILEHTQNWFSYTKLPFKYDPEALCPRFNEFLASIWGDDQDIKDCLKLWFGYMLLSKTDDHKMAILIGSSRGGKGVLIRLMKQLLGKRNTADMSISNLTKDFALSTAIGKRLLAFGDVASIPYGQSAAVTEKLLMLTGGDGIDVNRKFKDIVSIQMQVKIVMACNEFPQFMNARSALSNRLIVFPFSKSFFGKEDPGLDKALEAELPGILNWALEGSKRLLKGERLKMPSAAKPVLDEILQSLDSVYAFIQQRIRILPEARDKRMAVTADMLYKGYCELCKKQNYDPKSWMKFFKSFNHHTADTVIADRMVMVDGSRPKVYTNIELLNSDTEFESEGDLPPF